MRPDFCLHKLTPKLPILSSCSFKTYQHRPVGRGCDECARTPPTGSRGPFFVDQRLKQSEFRLLFYSNSLIVYCSKIENTVKELISLSHPFNKTCFSLRKLYIKKGIWYTYKKLTPF